MLVKLAYSNSGMASKGRPAAKAIVPLGGSGGAA
ncbi:hypothetical protein CTS44_08982 [Comamonas thiooxydans]|nr:hypothetical protein CTS44_08982 [Comamonas thiooxydans]